MKLPVACIAPEIIKAMATPTRFEVMLLRLSTPMRMR